MKAPLREELAHDVRTLERTYASAVQRYGGDSHEAAFAREELSHAFEALAIADRVATMPTQRLATAAERVFGKDWATPLSRALGRPSRTIQRIRKMAADGQEHSRAEKLLEELRIWLQRQARAIETETAVAWEDDARNAEAWRRLLDRAPEYGSARDD